MRSRGVDRDQDGRNHTFYGSRANDFYEVTRVESDLLPGLWPVDEAAS
jgi:hypothetical protein